MDFLWDAFKYHPKLSVNTFQAKIMKSHKLKKGQTENFRFVWRGIYMLYASFIKSAKKDPKTSSNGPNQENEKRHNAKRIPGNSVKVTILTFKISKLDHFSKIFT